MGPEDPTEIHVLKNGMRVIIKENHRLPEVSLLGAFLGGETAREGGGNGVYPDSLPKC